MNDRLRIALLLVIAALVYGNSLRNGFTMDDAPYVLNNPQVTHPSLGALFEPHTYTSVYRPLTFATLGLNWALNKDRPFGFHLVNLLLHAAVTLLLYMLLLEILGTSIQTKTTALVAGCLFAVHPIHTEAVTSIVGRAELLAAGFLLGAWILYLRDKWWLSLACFSLALLSKESAVVFVAMVLVGDYALGKWKPLSRYAWIAGLTAVYLVVLWKIQGNHFGRGQISIVDNQLASLPAGWRILNALRVSWKYIGLQLYPAKLSCDYSFRQILVYTDWRHTLPAAVAALGVVGLWLWAVRERHAGIILAGGIYMTGFAATSNILLPSGTIMGERLAYLPSAGFCLLVALGWNWLQERQRTVALVMFATAIAALATRTVVRNVDWENDFTLYSAGVQAAPGSAKMHANLGSQYLNFGQTDLARTELQTALAIYPNYPDALLSSGLLESSLGHFEAAGALIEKAVDMSRRDNPNYDFMNVSLAVMLIRTGRTDEALQILNREIAESPRYARAWSNRAVIYFKRGDTESARADAVVALGLDSSNMEAQNLMRLLSSPGPLGPPQ